MSVTVKEENTSDKCPEKLTLVWNEIAGFHQLDQLPAICVMISSLFWDIWNSSIIR